MSTTESYPRPLKITIVGAGIGGLTAAAALRIEGHEIFETPSMNKEIGASITLADNALRVLNYLGFDIEHLKAGDYLGVAWFDSKGGEDWNLLVTKEEPVRAFEDFDAQFTALFALVDGPVHLWQIRSLLPLPTWINGRAALIGDAAHATFPTIGQGAAMSIEDGVTIACLLPLGTTREQIPGRLYTYQTLRKERGEFVVRESLEQVTIPSKRGLYSRSPEMQVFIVNHDAVRVARENLAVHVTI
ncbi:hypothetical protein DFH07DRAFT_971508 [Mycena maculata]|uniref:FAD-binding domain-containing protein n=1 Tax=Mycena maculata TaxID=230809 RepID=A0AAD7MLU7_9AGAR|nr:hypothetical protein DFH07DRAFT_971508 [Mycena maculata]